MRFREKAVLGMRGGERVLAKEMLKKKGVLIGVREQSERGCVWDEKVGESRTSLRGSPQSERAIFDTSCLPVWQKGQEREKPGIPGIWRTWPSETKKWKRTD